MNLQYHCRECDARGNFSVDIREATDMFNREVHEFARPKFTWLNTLIYYVKKKVHTTCPNADIGVKAL